jgi:hypothetical protein
MNAEKTHNARLISFKPSAEMSKNCLSLGFKPSPTLEHFACSAVWQEAMSQGWLEKKSGDVILDSLIGQFRSSIIESGISSLFENQNLEMLPHLYDVKIERKKHFSQLFAASLEENNFLKHNFELTFKTIKSAFSG